MRFHIRTGWFAGSLIVFGVVCFFSFAAAPQLATTAAGPAKTTTKNWQVADLAGDLGRVEKARSFETGKKAFDDALCATCHRINGQGGDMGPDLGKPPEKGKKREGIDLLRAILEPSKDVDEKYQAYLIVTEGGEVTAGIITESGKDEIKVRTRPVGSQTAKTIPSKEIASIKKLDISIMPDGLVNALSKEQILDLLAYIEARGQRQDVRFR